MSGARMTSGPRFDPATGLVSGEIELPGGLPPEEPEDLAGIVDGPVTPELARSLAAEPAAPEVQA